MDLITVYSMRLKNVSLSSCVHTFNRATNIIRRSKPDLQLGCLAELLDLNKLRLVAGLPLVAPLPRLCWLSADWRKTSHSQLEIEQNMKSRNKLHFNLLGDFHLLVITRGTADQRYTLLAALEICCLLQHSVTTIDFINCLQAF